MELSLRRVLINSDSPFTSFQNNILAADYKKVANTSHYHKPRGSYVIDGICAPRTIALLFRTAILHELGSGWFVYVQFTTTEPLVLKSFPSGYFQL
jgi:hypothetical protein